MQNGVAAGPRRDNATSTAPPVMPPSGGAMAEAARRERAMAVRMTAVDGTEYFSKESRS